jgi:hypothetical protein
MPGSLDFLTKLMPDDDQPGEAIVHHADTLAKVLGRDVVTRIARGQLRIVGVSTLTGQLGVAVEQAFGPLQNGVVIVAEQQD